MSNKITVYTDCTRDECLYLIGKRVGERQLKNELLLIVIWDKEQLPDYLRLAIDASGVQDPDMLVCHGVSNIEQKARELQARWVGPEVRPLHIIYWMPQHIVADPDLECNGALPVYIASTAIQRQIASGTFQKVTIFVEPKSTENL